MTLIEPILNRKTSERVESQIESGGVNLANAAFKWALLGCLLFSLLVLGILIYDVLVDGWSVLSTRLDTFLANQPGQAPMSPACSKAYAAPSGLASLSSC